MDATTDFANAASSQTDTHLAPHPPPMGGPHSAASGTSESLLQSQPRRADLAILTPSARTSYTRVDLSAADVGTRDAEVAEMDAESESGINGADSPQQEAETLPEELDSSIPRMPQVSLTFLLVSGRRRTMCFDYENTVGRVKELVWNSWPHEWQDERPPAPSYLRVLYLGKMLQDDESLGKVGFPTFIPQGEVTPPSTPPPSTIVHLSVRSYAPAEEDEGLKKRGRRRRGGGDGGFGVEGGGMCCGCVIC